MNQAIETAIKCPTWCTGRHGALELEVGDVVHVQPVADLRTTQVSIELQVLDDGHPTGRTPHICTVSENVDCELSAAEARQYAAALLNAADALDQIHG